MKKLASILLIFTLWNCNTPKEHQDFTVGIIADCQYCNCDIKWNRYYRKAPQRLKEAVTELNKKELAYTIHLGDFIDKDFESYDSITPIWDQLKSTSYHVLGNHDFEVQDHLKSKIFDKLNLENRYYSFTQNNWKFIVLDGNDLSFYGTLDSLKLSERDQLFAKISKDTLPYAKKWNGGISKKQFSWLENELKKATKKDQKTVIYCHFPLLPIANDNLWNAKEVVNLLEKYDCVKAYLNGHNHEGAYVLQKDIHYVTFKAMVNSSDSTAFTTTKFTNDRILISSYGKSTPRNLRISN